MYINRRIIIFCLCRPSMLPFFLILSNILVVVILFFGSVGINLGLLYVEFISIVMISHSYIAVIGTPLIGITVSYHSVYRNKPLWIKLSFWNASNIGNICFVNLILNISRILISVASRGIFTASIYTDILFLMYSFTSDINASISCLWDVFVQFLVVIFINGILYDLSPCVVPEYDLFKYNFVLDFGEVLPEFTTVLNKFCIRSVITIMYTLSPLVG